MKIRQIEAEKLILHFSDNSRTQESSKKLEKYLKEGLIVLSKFLFSKNLIVKNKKVQAVELSLTLCGDKRIRTLNRDYRGKDKATDVLSFPVHDSLRPEGEDDFFFFDKILNLGDIIISRDVAKKQAKEFQITYEQEILHLMVHGLLHLCGYDHEIDESEEKIMFDLEEKLVAKIYKEIGF